MVACKRSSMKKDFYSVPIAVLVLVLLAGTACNKEMVNDNNGGDFTTRVLNLPSESLSSDEIASLAAIREEEKLARDVYTYFQYRWGQNIYIQLSDAEQSHMDAVLLVLNKYKLPDPSAGLGYGEFRNPVFQPLFDQLCDQGYASNTNALAVSVAIEEMDIRDINNALKMTDNQDITLVYKNLVRHSRNHLRSFYSSLVAEDGAYTPRYLGPAEFNAIVNSPMESGNWW